MQSTSQCRVPTEIPCGYITRADLEKDKDIAEAVSLDKDIQHELAGLIRKAIGVDTPAEAILFIGNRSLMGKWKSTVFKRLRQHLTKNFLPHLVEATRTEKIKPFSWPKWLTV